jgi:hypothetical protein
VKDGRQKKKKISLPLWRAGFRSTEFYASPVDNKTRRLEKIEFCELSPYLRPFKELRNRFPAWRTGTTTLYVVPPRQATKASGIDSSESMPGLYKRLQIRALYAVAFMVVQHMGLDFMQVPEKPGFGIEIFLPIRWDSAFGVAKKIWN